MSEGDENTETAAPVDAAESFAAFEKGLDADEETQAEATDEAQESAQDDAAEAADGEDDDSPEDKGDGEDGDDAKPRRRSKPERVRIGELTAQLRQTERELAALRESIKQPQAQEADEGAGPDDDSEPDPARYDYGEADARYIADTARWHARAEFRAQAETAALQSKMAEMDRSYEKRVTDSAGKYPDYAEKVIQSADRGEWACSPLMAVGIKDSPVGPDIAYALAGDPTEAARIAALHPFDQAREFGRLEARFMAQAKQEQGSQPVMTNAPEPPQQRVRGGAGQFQARPDTTDFEAFERLARGKG